MKKSLIVSLLVLAIMLSGCGGTGDTNLPQDEEEASISFLGKWQRTGNYANGELVSADSAVMTLRDDGTYSAVSTCSVSGTFGHEKEANVIIMTIGSSNCYGTTSGSATNWSYELSEDGTSLSLITGAGGTTVMETFVRIE